MLQRTVNLGILAHVDAGKTTLTERLLYTAGVIDEIGNVDDGTTQTDTLDLERRRGITIKSAVASFTVGDVAVNLIDTPGHPDFIAEVERALGVLDGAVLVVSAVEGVQPQTRILMRALQRLRVPTMFFINKIDRRGADSDRVLREITDRLTPAIVAMAGLDAARLTAFLAERDDSVLGAYLDGTALHYDDLRARLGIQTRRSVVHPVYRGSALTGAGVGELIAGIAELLPPPQVDADGPGSGRVFKVGRGPAGEKIAYVRMFAGAIHTRERIQLAHRQRKITGIEVFADGGTHRRSSARAGEIAKVWGLPEVRIDDELGPQPMRARQVAFEPPSLETVVHADDADDTVRLRSALAELAEQDPLINVRQDDLRQEIYLSLYGEVQKEVIEATLADDYGVAVSFRRTTTICVERLIGTGHAVERMRADGNPYLATVGLRIEPAPPGSGVAFRIEAELGSMPYAFFKAVEDTVRATLEEGLSGWRVTDCTVTQTDSGYLAKQGLSHQRFNKSMSSTGEDFRKLTPLVLMTALRVAGTTVCEPIHHFELDAPADSLAVLLAALTRLRAVPRTQLITERTALLAGDIPAECVHELRRRLPAWTRGEAALETAFERYDPVQGTAPTRTRSRSIINQPHRAAERGDA
ncbi:MAG TPA: GTP-binding protein [Jatrophihabitantaceae bacterium]